MPQHSFALDISVATTTLTYSEQLERPSYVSSWQTMTEDLAEAVVSSTTGSAGSVVSPGRSTVVICGH